MAQRALGRSAVERLSVDVRLVGKAVFAMLTPSNSR
jgi:hypothetical protein